MSVLIWRLCQNAQKIDDRFYSTNNGCAIHIPGRRVWIGEDSEATCGEELNLGRCFGRSKGRKRLSEANFCLKKFQGQLRKQQKWHLLRDIIIVFHCMIRMRKFIILLPGWIPFWHYFVYWSCTDCVLSLGVYRVLRSQQGLKVIRVTEIVKCSIVYKIGLAYTCKYIISTVLGRYNYVHILEF